MPFDDARPIRLRKTPKRRRRKGFHPLAILLIAGFGVVVLAGGGLALWHFVVRGRVEPLMAKDTGSSPDTAPAPRNLSATPFTPPADWAWFERSGFSVCFPTAGTAPSEGDGPAGEMYAEQRRYGKSAGPAQTRNFAIAVCRFTDSMMLQCRGDPQALLDRVVYASVENGRRYLSKQAVVVNGYPGYELTSESSQPGGGTSYTLMVVARNKVFALGTSAADRRTFFDSFRVR